jgi:hypothetical protein
MKKQIIALLTLAFFLGSCSKLDVTSLTDVTDEKVFQNADGVRSALIGMYSQMQQREYYGAFYPLMSDLHTDMVVAGGYENTVLNEFGDKTVTPSNGFIEQMYVSMYKTIRRMALLGHWKRNRMMDLKPPKKMQYLGRHWRCGLWRISICCACLAIIGILIRQTVFLL